MKKLLIMFVTYTLLACGTSYCAHDCMDMSKDNVRFYALEMHIGCNHECYHDPLSKILPDGTCTQCQHRRHVRPDIFVQVSQQELKQLKPQNAYATILGQLFYHEVEQSIQK